MCIPCIVLFQPECVSLELRQILDPSSEVLLPGHARGSEREIE